MMKVLRWAGLVFWLAVPIWVAVAIIDPQKLLPSPPTPQIEQEAAEQRRAGQKARSAPQGRRREKGAMSDSRCVQEIRRRTHGMRNGWKSDELCSY
jgi:hypothetical protein